MRLIIIASIVFIAFATSAAVAQTRPGGADDKRPTLFLVGDSTVKNGTKGQMGWGEQIGKYFETSRINVVNRAIGGRSSRSFQAEGRWDKVLEELRPGDFLLIQFGHNDGAKPGDPKQDPRNRGSLRGIGDETVEIEFPGAGKKETVHTYGWYMRKYVADAKARGATPIICSLVPRNDWKDGKVLRADQSYGKWAREIAEAQKTPFIDLNDIVAQRYEQLGQEKVKGFFPDEHTHVNAAGADVNAQCVVEGVAGLKDVPLAQYLTPEAQGLVKGRSGG